jgi:hypothetical protein
MIGAIFRDAKIGFRMENQLLKIHEEFKNCVTN